jgi:hypothetical protein
MSDGYNEYGDARAERRERKQQAKRERMAVHCNSLRQNFTDMALNLARKRLKRTARRR